MSETDFKRLEARQIALTGVMMAMLTHLKGADIGAHADVEISAGTYINRKIREGTPEHAEALQFLRLTLLSGAVEHP